MRPAASLARIVLAGSAMLASSAALGQIAVADGATPINTDQPAGIVTPVAMPAWTSAAARQLLSAIDRASAEGLKPADYRPAALRRALEGGEGPALDAVADAASLALAHDFYFGRLSSDRRQEWHISRPEEQSGNLAAMLRTAVDRRDVDGFLKGLLPRDARYAALRDALESSADPVERNRIRANMERWRWMPRGLGENYLYVNVPSYRLQVIEGETVTSTYTVVVGAPGTPTPWLATEAPSVVVNPWWNVPQSIIKSANLRPGRGGYIFKASAGGWQVRQPPGPRNALGKLKINLVNDQAIYLHDTPAKAGFAKDQRALSHGCIRVKGIDQLATELMGAEGDPASLQEALAGKDTATVNLPRRWPVYLVYFTMDRDENGRLATYGDPYGRDADLVARLDGSPLQIASN